MSMQIQMPNESSYALIKALVQELGGRVTEIIENNQNKNIGEILKLYRNEYGFTQKQLAAVLKVPQSHISAYEKNKRRIPYKRAVTLSAMFNCHVNDFIAA